MTSRLNYSGFVVAGTGFFLTRFTVTLAVYEDPVRFYLAGIVPLVLGLGLSAFGVALVVADIDRAVVRTTAAWCVAGTVAMLVLVVLTLLGSNTGEMPTLEALRSRTYMSNFLIGGSVGGTMTGLYAARNRRQQRVLRQQANRLEVLNRLLRHEVLNALTVIRGYAAISKDPEQSQRAEEVIDARVSAIESTIAEVKNLTRTSGATETPVGPIDLEACLRSSVATVERRYPDANVSVGSIPEGLTIVANERIDRVFVHLLENAVVHTGENGDPVELSVTPTANSVRVSVRDRGSGLPESQQRLLETGEIEQFDNPGSGFGLNVVRFLVENYRGIIETDVDDGTTVTVELPRGENSGTGLPTPSSRLRNVRSVIPHLVVTLVAAILAGVGYGFAAEAIGGSVSIIGVFYGIQNPIVGWITHEFHSVVFGFVFFGLASMLPRRYRNHVPAYVGLGLGWALVLWFVAAGVVSAIWLRLLGIPASLPSLSVVTLVSHLVWGVSIGAITAFGFEHVTPRLERLGERLSRR